MEGFLLSNKKIAFIGAGNMATAIIDGMLRNKTKEPSLIYVYDLDHAKLEIMQKKNINISASACEAVENSDIIVLAVKPQNYEEVLVGIKDVVTKQKIFVSIAAGISTGYVTRTLETAYNMFALSGEVCLFPESKMNEVISINGSSPAYFYLFALAMREYAEEVGFDGDTALKLIAKTLEGSAHMIPESGDSLETLIFVEF